MNQRLSRVSLLLAFSKAIREQIGLSNKPRNVRTNPPTLDRPVDQSPAAIVIPGWALKLSPRFHQRLGRIARRHGVSEAAAMELALTLLEEKKQDSFDSSPSTTEDYIYIKALAKKIPLKKAREILGEISAYFGAFTKLGPEERERRARLAANARWQKKREQDTPAKK